MSCQHPREQHGTRYAYCPDCGATRRLPKPGERFVPDPWHVCDRCRLPGAPR